MDGTGGFSRTMRFADIAELEERRGEFEEAVHGWCDGKDGASRAETDPEGGPSLVLRRNSLVPLMSSK